MMIMSDLYIRRTIPEARAIYSMLHDSRLSGFYFNGMWFLTAPTFEEFITRNRLILHEEVSR